ncbi:MAG TPA: SPFH domain-containing protein [Steroidobacteraceae bacterium]|jgi:regulator of protease activity HflC (stomatin/prohibitin superfamily)|nr:SPFH domain-containing protein [Steroidobacteraceae bacterium]
MSDRLQPLLELARRWVFVPLQKFAARLGAHTPVLLSAAARRRRRLALIVLLAALGYGLYRCPPFASVHRGELLVRSNVFSNASSAYTAGTVLVLPGLQQVRRFSTRDQVYRALESASASGPAPFQSNEGLSIGVDLTVRWAIDRTRIAQQAREFPDDLNADLVQPAVEGVVYPLFARHSVREIFSAQRAQISQEIAAALAPKLASVGLTLRDVDMGKVDLPPDYRAGMEKLLAQELETEKVRYTLQLKEAQVKQSQLEGEADKVRREKAAEAAGQEQVIAARAQEETMKHILPFKQKQIEQRRLEAEAEKVARIRTAEGAAEAHRIEARAEADSRQKLADAEAYRLDLVGKANAGQMEREGVLLARYPLLIEKTLADKLSDKVQVIIAPTPEAGQFIGSNLLGAARASTTPVAAAALAVDARAAGTP